MPQRDDTAFRKMTPAGVRGPGALIAEIRSHLQRVPRHETTGIPRHQLVGSGVCSEARKPRVVLERDTSVELGHPSVLSLAMVLATDDDNNVVADRITRIGPKLSELRGQRVSYGQLAFLHTKEPLEPFALQRAQRPMDVVGLSVRAIPGRLWYRIHRDATGLDVTVLGSSLLDAFRSLPGVLAAEVVLIADSAPLLRSLAPLALEAEAVAGTHRRLAVDPGGELTCREAACDTCGDKTVCDELRELIAARARGRRS